MSVARHGWTERLPAGRIAYVNGRYVPHSAAAVHIEDRGLQFASQYTLPLMGRYRRQLLDKDVGVYRYDGLVVLSRTKSAAVLLEAGSIINRGEEMAMNSPERQEMIALAVTAAMRGFCEKR